MAKHYTEKEIAKWTVNDLIAYMDDQHRERFGIDYQPFGGWAAERGRIGQWFGTARKAGKYDKELVKEFVDHCFATYKPTQKYPGVAFSFMATYMTREFQTVQKQYNIKIKDSMEIEKQNLQSEGMEDWFNS